LHFPSIKPETLSGLSNYIGSVTCNSHEDRIAFSSPKGNTVLALNNKGKVLTNQNIKNVCGLSEFNNSFICSSMDGLFHGIRDNHLGRIAFKEAPS